MIEYALLSLLRDESDYGYRLKQRFDQALGGTWRLNIGQVYQALQGLERRGLIREVEPEVGDDARAKHSYGRARRLYRATDRGVRALERWTRRRLPRPIAARDEMLLRLLAVERGGAAAAALIVEREAACRARLEECRPRSSDPNPHELDAVGELSVAAEVLHLEAQLAWVARCRTLLGIHAPERSSATPRLRAAAG